MSTDQNKLDLERDAKDVGKNVDFNADFADEDIEFEDQDDTEANREHEDGEATDEAALAKTADDELTEISDRSSQQKPAETIETPPAIETKTDELPIDQTTVQPTGEPAIAPAVAEVTPAAVTPTEAIAEVTVPSQEDIQSTYATWKDNSERLLAEHYYALTPEVQAELELEPAKVIPRLMAKTYLDAMTASIGQMTMHFPRMVRLVLDQMDTETKTENEFFSAWPQLKGKEADVQRFGQAWRQLNPSASQQQFIDEVGAGVMVALRLDPTPASARNGNGQQSQLGAFKPGLGAPPRSQAKNAGSEDNPFTRLNAEFEEDLDDDGN